MEPVSNADRIALILREKLAERARRARAATPGKAGRALPRSSSVAALAALADTDDRQYRRAVIQAVLVDNFGREVMNDPSFQQVVEQVLSAIEGDEDARTVLTQAAHELRSR